MSSEKNDTSRHRSCDLTHINYLKSSNEHISYILSRLHMNAQRLGTIIDLVQEEEQKIGANKIAKPTLPP